MPRREHTYIIFERASVPGGQSMVLGWMKGESNDEVRKLAVSLYGIAYSELLTLTRRVCSSAEWRKALIAQKRLEMEHHEDTGDTSSI